MDPVVEGTLQTSDGYWRVEVVRYARRERWYRVWHANTIVADQAPLGTVQWILGDAMATLKPVDATDADAS